MFLIIRPHTVAYLADPDPYSLHSGGPSLMWWWKSLLSYRWWARHITRRMPKEWAALDSVRGVWDHNAVVVLPGSLIQDHWRPRSVRKDHRQGSATEAMRACHHLQPDLGRRPRSRYWWHTNEAQCEARLGGPMLHIRFWRWLHWYHSGIYWHHRFKVNEN